MKDMFACSNILSYNKFNTNIMKLIKYISFCISFFLLNLISCNKEEIPSLSTPIVSDIEISSATCTASITDEGSSPVKEFGICWSKENEPTIYDYKTFRKGRASNYVAYMINLHGETKYYVRAYAINGFDVGYGAVVSFTTSDMSLSELKTSSINYITPKSAFSNGIVTFEGDPRITKRGFCWDVEPIPDTSDNHWTNYNENPYFKEYKHLLSNLNPETTYYVRAFALNEAGISYGNELSFTTPADLSGTEGTVTDVEGNIYKTISIGTQIWMSENLKTTKYNDGGSIPLVTDAVIWSNLTTPAYCWYDNEEATYKNLYGALYNWSAVNTGNLCPIGWHVASEDNWIIIESYLGGEEVAGKKLKEAGFEHWKLTQGSKTGTNESGFTSLPSGSRAELGYFSNIEKYNLFWASTPSCGLTGARYRLQSVYDDENSDGCTSNKRGGSVRCVKD
jgi:uncharacterized protein (TIGR02145 family)